jgi:hypothetical protein
VSRGDVSPCREAEAAEPAGPAEGFRETLLVEFGHDDAMALRRVGSLLFEHVRTAPFVEDPARQSPPFWRFQAVSRDLRHLEGYLRDIVAVLLECETHLPAGEVSRLVELARLTAVELEHLADEFDREVGASAP